MYNELRFKLSISIKRVENKRFKVKYDSLK